MTFRVDQRVKVVANIRDLALEALYEAFMGKPMAHGADTVGKEGVIVEHLDAWMRKWAPQAFWPIMGKYQWKVRLDDGLLLACRSEELRPLTDPGAENFIAEANKQFEKETA